MGISTVYCKYLLLLFSLVFPGDGWLGLSQDEASQSDVFLDGSGDGLAEAGDGGRHPWALRLLSHKGRLGPLASHRAGPNPKLVALVLENNYVLCEREFLFMLYGNDN